MVLMADKRNCVITLETADKLTMTNMITLNVKLFWSKNTLCKPLSATNCQRLVESYVANEGIQPEFQVRNQAVKINSNML